MEYAVSEWGLRSKVAVSCIAEARDDVVAFIEPLINGGSEDRHVGMSRLESRDAHGATHDAGKTQALDPGLLELIRGFNGAAPCGEHRIKEKDIGVAQQTWQLCIIGLRQRGLFIPGDADVSDDGIGHEIENAINESKPGPQDRHEDDGSSKSRSIRDRERCGDLDGGYLDVSACLDEEQRCESLKCHAKVVRSRCRVPQTGKKDASERMLQDMNIGSHGHHASLQGGFEKSESCVWWIRGWLEMASGIQVRTFNLCRYPRLATAPQMVVRQANLMSGTARY